jgi:hypothetical protein
MCENQDLVKYITELKEELTEQKRLTEHFLERRKKESDKIKKVADVVCELCDTTNPPVQDFHHNISNIDEEIVKQSATQVEKLKEQLVEGSKEANHECERRDVIIQNHIREHESQMDCRKEENKEHEKLKSDISNLAEKFCCILSGEPLNNIERVMKCDNEKIEKLKEVIVAEQNREQLVKKENRELKKENEKLKENVFNADTRCSQFRTKVGHSFIHDILTDYCRIDVDRYDGDVEEDHSYIVEGNEDFLFEECASAISHAIDTYIRLPNSIQDINEYLCEEVDEVVDKFKTNDMIKNMD